VNEVVDPALLTEIIIERRDISTTSNCRAAASPSPGLTSGGGNPERLLDDKAFQVLAQHYRLPGCRPHVAWQV